MSIRQISQILKSFFGAASLEIVKKMLWNPFTSDGLSNFIKIRVDKIMNCVDLMWNDPYLFFFSRPAETLGNI
jgi:hypothetical protein